MHEIVYDNLIHYIKGKQPIEENAITNYVSILRCHLYVN